MFKMMLGIENVEERDLPTILVHTLQLNKNVDIIRVHNVKQAKIMKKIYERIC
jgi:dihydropteroate synthase